MKSSKIKNWPLKERPRERLIAEGAERLTDAQLLAIILRVGRGTFVAEVRKAAEELQTQTAREVEEMIPGIRPVEIGEAIMGRCKTSLSDKPHFIIL